MLVIRLKDLSYFVFLSGLSPFERDRNSFLSAAYKPTQNLSCSIFWISRLLFKERFYKISHILLLKTLPPVELILPALMLLLKLSLNWVQSDLRKSYLYLDWPNFWRKWRNLLIGYSHLSCPSFIPSCFCFTNSYSVHP